jgi:O-acetyl-ADP-ribose deacetylase (regulator of RNase III)
MSPKITSYLFGNRDLIILTDDLLSASTDVIVNPANAGLSHGGGLAAQILIEAGDMLQQESDNIISSQGMLETSQVVFTKAGRLPYKAIIHAVGPKMGEGSEQLKIEKTIGNCLKLCDDNHWSTIALPAISTGIFSVPLNYCAQAYYQAINHYWSIHKDSQINQIIVYLGDEHFDEFTQIFESLINQDEATIHLLFADPIIRMGDMEEEDDTPSTGYIDLSDDSSTDKDKSVDDEIDKWFT